MKIANLSVGMTEEEPFMLLSVVIPVYNGEKYLKTRVNSLIEAGGGD